MRDSIRQDVPPSQGTNVGQPDSHRSTAVDQPTELELLRQVIAEKGETLDSLSAHMASLDRPRDRSYIHKVIAGEKPMPPGFSDDLPDDVQAEWHARCTKRLKRHHVLPVLSPEEALEQYRAGLVNLSAPQLPEKSSGQLRVNLDVRRKAAAR